MEPKMLLLSRYDLIQFRSSLIVLSNLNIVLSSTLRSLMWYLPLRLNATLILVSSYNSHVHEIIIKRNTLVKFQGARTLIFYQEGRKIFWFLGITYKI
jgi:hypothetical protein